MVVQMARYTITGVVYDAEGFMATVDVSTTSHAEYDNWRQALQLHPAYRFVCAVQEGNVISRKEFVKGA